jgi:VCBS repeat-containing protein
VVTASANPSKLSPNGKMVSVTVSGKITDNLSGADTGSGSYSTADSYGLVQPAGSFSIASDGSYSFTVQLEGRRNSAKDGRTYTITVNANDLAGNPGRATVTVTVGQN